VGPGVIRTRPVDASAVERCIVLVRGHKVLLDADLAALYDVTTKALNQAVKRNLERFPADFMFRLSWEEAAALRSHIVTLDKPAASGAKRGAHMKYRPYAFTEQGVAMLSSVLRSPGAIVANIEIMRAFVRLREIIALNRGLAKRLDELEAKYDGQFRVVFDAIRELMRPSATPKRRRIGFVQDDA
jgi:ORF6N domain-containing protein